MDRGSDKMDVHPWHQHSLERLARPLKLYGDLSGIICQVCMRPLTLQMKQEQITRYYRCKERCDYYLHDECYWLIRDLIGKRQVHHPLHPQHHLILHDYIDAAAGDDSPNLIRSKFEFNVCSFCNQTIESEFFFHCSSNSSSSISLSCDFYLHIACSTGFMHHPELLSNFHIQHFLHHPHDINHRLSPHIQDSYKDWFDNNCKGCRQGKHAINRENMLTFKCITCKNFNLHVQCSQIPKQILEHCHHPQHPLTLHALMKSKVILYCHACRCSIKNNIFVICCTDVCCNFNLCIQCAFLKPNMIPNGHHHPLVHFGHIYWDDVLCSACKTPCKYDSFRCIPCNYNIHSHCISLPIIVDQDDVHVHPLTLTLSFVEDKWDHYYCDICETKRDPNHSVYSCEQCPFVAHIQCALPNDHPLMLEGYFSQKIQDGSNKSADEDDKTLVNSNEVISVDRSIFLQLDSEVGKLGEVVKQLIIKVKQGEQLTETLLEELDERQANTEAKLRELKKNF